MPKQSVDGGSGSNFGYCKPLTGPFCLSVHRRSTVYCLVSWSSDVRVYQGLNALNICFCCFQNRCMYNCTCRNRIKAMSLVLFLDQAVIVQSRVLTWIFLFFKMGLSQHVFFSKNVLRLLASIFLHQAVNIFLFKVVFLFIGFSLWDCHNIDFPKSIKAMSFDFVGSSSEHLFLFKPFFFQIGFYFS